MSLGITLAILIAAISMTAIANWRERRPHALDRTPLIPYSAIQMVGIVLAILMAAHLISLVTGHPLHGRRMP